VTIAALGLAACGQTGPLYLPGEAPAGEVAAPPSVPPAATPAGGDTTDTTDEDDGTNGTGTD
jgi:predicted small lipoprotein YifL